MNHVMVDLETLGTKPGSVILSIGAVWFNEEGLQKQEFSCNVRIDDSFRNGFTVDSDTILWWLQQDKAAIKKLIESKAFNVRSSLINFADWFYMFPGKDAIIWSNGADFDTVLLGVAYKHMELLVPWGFRNVRCFRTLKALHPVAVIGDAANEVRHCAVDDARYQARLAIIALSSLGML